MNSRDSTGAHAKQALGSMIAALILALAAITVADNTTSLVIELKTLEEDLMYFESCYSSLLSTKRDALINLRQTVVPLSERINPYDQSLPTNIVHAQVLGTAGRSSDILAVSFAGSPELSWILRGYNFCWGAVAMKSFEQLTVFELLSTCHLVRLPIIDAASLDEEISRIWQENYLPEDGRGNPTAFQDFVKTISVDAAISQLRRIQDARFVEIKDRINRFNQMNDVGDFQSAGNEVKVGATLSALRTDLLRMTENDLPYFGGIDLPRNAFQHVVPVLLTILSYVTLALWRQELKRNNEYGILKLSQLVGLQGNHGILNVTCLIGFVAIVAWALIANSEMSRRIESYPATVLGWICLLTFCVSTGYFFWRKQR